MKYLPAKYLRFIEDNFEIIFLGFLIISGFIFRFILAGSISLWEDEAITATVARSLSDGLSPTLPTGKEYLRGTGFIFLVHISENIFGRSEIGTRLPSIIISTLTIFFTFIGGKEFFSKRTGIIAALIVTFLPWQLALGTQVRMYVLLQLIYLISVILIYRIGENALTKEAIILGVIIAFGMTVHRTAYILPIIAATYLFTVRIRSIDFKKILVVSIPVIFAFFVTIFRETYSDLFYFINYNPDNFSYYLNWLASNSRILTSLSLLSSYICLKRNKKVLYLFLLSIIPTFLIYSLFIEFTASRYLYYMVPFLCILSAYLVDEFINSISSLTDIKLQRFFYVLIASILIVIIFTTPNYNSNVSNYRPVYDHQSVYNYISENDSNNDILITQWTSSATYYYRAPDYSLHGEEFVNVTDRYSYKGKNEYSGAKFIFKAKELEKIVQNSTGWLVLREGALERKPKGIQQVVKGGMYEVGEFRNMKVWRWNNTGSLGERDGR